ncbi:MAG: fasciclin domain-containing protein [Gemmatimonadaceae bacterium]
MNRKPHYAVAALAAIVTLSACASTPMAEPAKNIVQVASENGSFNTLVTAVKAAGLVETLEGPGPFTVFAPTDAAFAKLPAGTINSLLANKDALTSILTYHVVSGRTVASDITRMNGAMPSTVNGQPLNITVRAGKVYVNGAQVIMADVQASNGVIHVIDAVLMPTVAAR